MDMDNRCSCTCMLVHFLQLGSVALPPSLPLPSPLPLLSPTMQPVMLFNPAKLPGVSRYTLERGLVSCAALAQACWSEC